MATAKDKKMDKGNTDCDDKPAADQGAPAEFPLTLEEFLAEISDSKVEPKATFRYIAETEGIGGSKPRAEWRRLYELSCTKPCNLTWKEWTKGGN